MLLSPFILADPVARKKLTKAAAVPETPPSPPTNAPTTPERPPFRTLPISSPLSRSTSRVNLQYEGLPSASKERKQTFLGLLRGKLSIDKSSNKVIKDVERTKPLFGIPQSVSGSDEDEKHEDVFKSRPVGGLASSVSVHNLRQLFERSNEAPGIGVSLKPPRAKNLLSRDVLNRSDATLVETPVEPDVPDINAQVKEDLKAHHEIDIVARGQIESQETTTPEPLEIAAVNDRTQDIVAGAGGQTGSQEITTPDSLAIATVPDDTTQASDEGKQSAQRMLAFSGQQAQLPSGQTHACDMIVCGVKTVTVNSTRVHEIDLQCHGCGSSFVCRAAHECCGDDTDHEDSPQDEGKDNGCFPSVREPGLEWLRDERADYINIIC